jgi:putative membrane protein
LTIVFAAHPIVHVNASLNALATVLLVVGLVFIKRGRVDAHKWTMLAAFGVSTVFLMCYLWYHYHVGSVRFTHPGLVKYIYLAILTSHVLLAVTVPFLAIRQIYLGYRAIGCCGGEMTQPEKMAATALYLEKHLRLAKWVFPIWLYVSVTGVVVYVMLYHLWPPIGQ